MMLPATVSVQKRPTNEDEMLAAAYKDIYKQLRKNGELPGLTGGYEIDPQTGDYYSDFYSKRKVLGNPSSNLKPYIKPEAVNFAVDFFTEDFRTLADRNASFGEKLEAGFFIIFRPAKAAKKVAKAGENISDVGKDVSKGTGKLPSNLDASNSIAKNLGGKVTTLKNGYKIEIPNANGKKTIVVRVMNEGSGGRTEPYFES